MYLDHKIVRLSPIDQESLEASKADTYPLLGPLFIGTRLNWHVTSRRRQFEQVSTPDSEVASQRTY